MLVLVLGVLLTKSDHELVPVHEVVPENQVKELLKGLGISSENLPKIFTTDPQAVKLGAKTGQIIRIHRNDSGNEYLYYRVVVEG